MGLTKIAFSAVDLNCDFIVLHIRNGFFAKNISSPLLWVSEGDTILFLDDHDMGEI